MLGLELLRYRCLLRLWLRELHRRATLQGPRSHRMSSE
jgi:hypothetical protein